MIWKAEKGLALLMSAHPSPGETEKTTLGKSHMSIQDLGSLGELIAAFATILTLGYLAFQVRQNNNLASGATQRELMNEFNVILDRIRSNPEVWVRGFRHFEELTDAEKTEFEMVFNTYINHLELVLRMADRGLETQDNLDIYGDICLAMVQEPGGMVCWEACKPLFFRLSREYIERRLVDKATLPPPAGELLPWYVAASEPVQAR